MHESSYVVDISRMPRAATLMGWVQLLPCRFRLTLLQNTVIYDTFSMYTETFLLELPHWQERNEQEHD